MASTGLRAFERNFANRILETYIKVDEAIVYKTGIVHRHNILTRLAFKTPVRTLGEKGNNNKLQLISFEGGEGYVGFDTVKKQCKQAFTINANKFLEGGTKTTITYFNQDIEVMYFSSPQELQNSIQSGLHDNDEISGELEEVLRSLFQNPTERIDWKNLPKESIFATAKGLGSEVLSGLLALQNRLEYFDFDFCSSKVKGVAIPEKANCPEIDSFFVLTNGQIIPVSSKSGEGAQSSILGNFVKPVVESERHPFLQDSAFKRLCNCYVENRGNRREIIYRYAFNHHWKMVPRNWMGQIDFSAPYNEISKGLCHSDSTKQLLELVAKTAKSTIAEKLPNSLTACAAELIANDLNECEVSNQQLNKIILDKNVHQLHLNKNSWLRGYPDYKVVRPVVTKILCTMGKFALGDITGSQGMLCYKLQIAG